MLYTRGRATQTQPITRRQRPVRAEAHTARAAHSGGATRQHALLELQDALVDVKGVRHHDRMRDALPMELAVRARALGVLGARILLGLTADALCIQLSSQRRMRAQNEVKLLTDPLFRQSHPAEWSCKEEIRPTCTKGQPGN